MKSPSDQWGVGAAYPGARLSREKYLLVYASRNVCNVHTMPGSNEAKNSMVGILTHRAEVCDRLWLEERTYSFCDSCEYTFEGTRNIHKTTQFYRWQTGALFNPKQRRCLLNISNNRHPVYYTNPRTSMPWTFCGVIWLQPISLLLHLIVEGNARRYV